VLRSGAVRFRPILLTALAAMFGSWVITLDPIFSGLAWFLIFGLFASTAFSLVVVPVIFSLQASRHEAENQAKSFMGEGVRAACGNVRRSSLERRRGGREPPLR